MAKLRFTFSDNSGRAREELRVYGANYVLYATLKQPLAPVRPGVVRAVLWKVPRKKAASKLKSRSRRRPGGQPQHRELRQATTRLIQACN